MLEVKDLSYKIKSRYLVNSLSLQLLPGNCMVVMGANGAGKSTLLKMIAGAIKPTDGNVLFNGKNIQDYTKPQLAQQRAVLSQHYHINFPITAKEVVMMGRYPYFDSSPRAVDEAIVSSTMEQMQVGSLASREYNTLSGGEAQKIQMCRVLSQIHAGDNNSLPRMLLLDEPVSHLDIKYQHQLLQAAKDLCKQQVSVFAVLHDINLALKFADQILFMKNGSVAAQVGDGNAITPALLKEVFDVDAAVYDIPGRKEKSIVY